MEKTIKLLEEKWKDIKGYEGYYEISNYGRVRSRYQILTNQINSHKFYLVNLSVKGKGKSTRVHRLVAEAFIPKIEGKNDVFHIDGNLLNNHVNNLKWGKKAKITIKIAEEIRSIHKTKKISCRKLGEIYNLHETTIGQIIKNKIWRL
jgi:hypothetical protein